MSLMTQSLRRLAERQGNVGSAPPSLGTEGTPRRQPEIECSPGSLERATSPAATILLPDAAVPQHQRSLPEESATSRHAENAAPQIDRHTAAAIRPRAARRRYRPLEVSPAVAKLRDAILRDVSRGEAGASGRVIAIAGIQAESDAASAVTSLSRASVGFVGGEVLTINAGSLRTRDQDQAAGDGHGLTSLIDGTRRLHDVIASATRGIALVPLGLSKGYAQVVDESAILQLIRDCREKYGCTWIHGGEWDSKYLPPLARAADAFYVVVRANRTEREIAKRAVKHFDRAGVHVRGCVLAGADP